MNQNVRLDSGRDEHFPMHVFEALGVEPRIFKDRIGGSVMLVEKRPDAGPITVMTAGASRLPTDTGERVELAVEVVEDQQGAARIALAFVCDDIATKRRVPPFGAPWRNGTPFLNGTAISAIVATGSRWGAQFDDVRDEAGTVIGHVRTLRLLTDNEAVFVRDHGWDSLVERVGLDSLLDVERGERYL